MISRSSWGWIGLHLLLGLALPLLLVAFTGCMRAKASQEDLGPAVSEDLITQKLLAAMNRASLANLAQGQNITYTHSRRLENEEEAENMGSRYIEVVDHQSTDDQDRFTLNIDETERTDVNSWRDVKFESALWLNKTTASALSAQVHVDSDTPGQPGAVTYHHLQESDNLIDPPDVIKGRAGCNGLNGCKLHVHYIHFDAVIWQDSTTYQKITYDLGFSLDTPYLPYGVDIFTQSNGSLISDCRSTFIPINNSNVFVRDCYDLADFKR